MLLAIAPVLVVLPAIAIIGALTVALRAKPKLPDVPAPEPQLPPVPTPDPAVMPDPFLTMTSGEHVAALSRMSPNLWAWKITGPRPDQGTGPNAGAAALDMARALAEAQPGLAVVGDAGGGGEPTVEFSVEQDGDRWSWTVTSVPGVASLGPQMLGSGEEASRGSAVLHVLSTVSSEVAWLGVPSQEGGSVPIPQPDPPASDVDLPGIIVVGNTLGVVNLSAWVAHARTSVRQALAQGLDADGMMDSILGENLPETAKLNGRSIASVRQALQGTLDRIYSDSYVDAVAPDDKVAAQIVGSDVVRSEWLAKRHSGHVIVAKSQMAPGSGGIGIPKVVWEYLIFPGPARRYDDSATERKVFNEPDWSRAKTIRAAEQSIDGTAPDDPQAPGGNDPLVLLDVLPGAFAPPAPLADSVSRSVKLAPARWTAREAMNVEVFDFAKGANATRKDWTISIGVCITVPSNTPFGLLSTTLQGGAAPAVGQFGDAMMAFEIRNLPGGGGIGGNPIVLTDWSGFRQPLVYKAQFEGKFERGALVKITKQLVSIAGSAMAADVDPCPNRSQSWPVPSNPAGFSVLGNGIASWSTWDPAPRFKIIHVGPKIMLRVNYAGFPVFAQGQGGKAPALMPTPTTAFDIQVKTVADGRNH